MIRLTCIHGPASGLTCEFKRRVKLGRDASCQVIVPDVALSRQHVEVSWREGRVMVHDLGSANGTWVNNQNVKFASLTNGEQFRVGESTFRVEFDPPKTKPQKTSPVGSTLAIPSKQSRVVGTLIALLVALAVTAATWWLLFRPTPNSESPETERTVLPIERSSPARN